MTGDSASSSITSTIDPNDPLTLVSSDLSTDHRLHSFVSGDSLLVRVLGDYSV